MKPLTPEQRLIFSIVKQAIKDASQESSANFIKKEANHWLESDSLRPFSANWCIEALGGDVEEKQKILSFFKKNIQKKANMIYKKHHEDF